MKLETKFLLLPAALGMCVCNAQEVSRENPNIVIIYVDDLGYGDLSCYGATRVQTPNIDKLAENGVRFTDAHCSAATCTPSRYSLLTGSYAFRGNASILPGDAPMIISENTPTLPGMLQENGYITAVIGKWHLGLGDGNVDWNGKIVPGPLERGFDYSFLIPATNDRVPCVLIENHHVLNLDPEDPIQVSYREKIGTDPTGTENPELLRFPADKQHSGTIVNGVSRIGWMSGGNSARWKDEKVPHQMLKKARQFINENRSKPFFIYFSFPEIHVPRLPDYRFMGATEMGPMGDVIVQVDWVTGQLVEYLEKLGLSENTLIFFTSDNGPVLFDGYEDFSVELLGAHKPAGPFRGGKYSAFEAGTRMPTIAYWPAVIKPKVSDALFSQVDLFASIASLVGHSLSGSEAPDSYDLLDVLTGRSESGREYVLKETPFTFSLRKGNYKYIQPIENLNRVRNIEEVKEIESGGSLQPQLYDLSLDIGEQNNIAPQNKQLANEMENMIQKILTDKQTR